MQAVGFQTKTVYMFVASLQSVPWYRWVALDVHREWVTNPEQQGMVPFETAVYEDGVCSSTRTNWLSTRRHVM